MATFISGGSGGLTNYRSYGSFYDTTDQSALSPNVAYAMKFNNTDADATSGVSIENNTLGDPTRIQVANAGVYNIQFSAQLYRSTGGTAQTIDIWFRLSETDIPNSTTKIDVKANQNYFVAAWNFFSKMNANQYIEIMWAVSSTDISIQYDAISSPHTAIPSTIATINQVN